MRPLTFIYSHDNIFASVKQESSLLAVRRKDENGDSLFENLVFDEAYLILFRQLFFDAQAEVTPALSAYMKEVPVKPEFFETQDFSSNRDYTFYLLMPDDWNFHLSRPLNIKVKQFIVAYIMYRWLETKLPQESAVYLERANSVLGDAKSLLNKMTQPFRRSHGYFEL